MQPQTKGERTKRHLYRCAIELFKKNGYQNVSVDEIVKKAGTAKGTFYVHYDSKAAVIAQMLQEYDDYYDSIEENLSPALPVTERLEVFIRSSCRFTEEVVGLDMIRVLYTTQLASGQLEQDALRRDRTLYRIILGLLDEGRRTGIFRADQSVDQMGEWLIRCLRGTFYEWTMREGAFDLSEECIRFVRAFCVGLETRGGAV